MRQDVRLADRGMTPVVCASCSAQVLVRKSSWEQTSVQWDEAAVETCLERRASNEAPFPGCGSLRDAVREAAVRGDLAVDFD